MNEKGDKRGEPAIQIVKEIVIDAPPSSVWRHLTDATRIAGWLMPNDFEAKVGRPFTMDCNQQGKIDCVVKEVVPEKRLVYSFQSNVTRVETIVTITLTAEGKGTRVKLVHTGWDALPPSDRGDVIGGFDQGWVEHLERLRRQLV